jgi:hypothetical protein
MRMARYILNIGLVLLFITPELTWANKKLLDEYISNYKDIAISEMKRTGIPASIKLAQGILESDMGRSPLASVANNHFGIKCGSNWNGDVYFKHDDDRDDKGNLIESCFRAFKSVEQSYIAHSEFLRDPNKKSRYGFLFDLGSQDYEGWANGLKFAGYATDPKYPSKLIKLIEIHKLYLFDDATHILPIDQDLIASSSNNNETSPKEQENIKNKPTQPNQNKKGKTSVINGLYVVYSQKGENLRKVSQRTGKNVFDLLEYNEGISSLDAVLSEGDIVFLEKKKKAYYGDDTEYYIVKGQESLYQISQIYGIRLESLLAKNNLPENAVPKKGAQISLVRHLSSNETPPFTWIEKFDSYVDMGDLK